MAALTEATNLPSEAEKPAEGQFGAWCVWKSTLGALNSLGDCEVAHDRPKAWFVPSGPRLDFARAQRL